MVGHVLAKMDAAAAGSPVAADTAAGLAVDSPLYKLERLIVDWPFDFHFPNLPDISVQEELLVASVNESLSIERIREQFGGLTVIT